MTYRFGIFAFDAKLRELRRNGQPVALEPQPARALTLLLARSGEVVTREELRQVVWDEGTHVDFDRGLAYVLSQIRAALQDSASNPRFLQTIPRQGYRFIAPLEPVSAPPSPLQPPEWSRSRFALAAGAAALAILGGGAVALRKRSPVRLAVSIFDNETGQPELDQWVQSLSDSVVTALTPLDPSRLLIIGNAAPLRRPRNIRNLRALASELDAQYILLGQLQAQPSGLRFTTHFIRLPEETHLRARRLEWPSAQVERMLMEQAVVAEFIRNVREHILNN